MLEPHNPEAYTASKQAKYEGRIVKELLQRYELTDLTWMLLKEGKRSRRKPALLLEHFHARFPDFPIHLRAYIINKVSDVYPLYKLFKRLTTLPLYEEYRDLVDSVRSRTESRSVGVVFPWPYIKHGLVLHNHPISTKVQGARMFWVLPEGQLVLEPLDVLLNTVDKVKPPHTWKRPT
jgi:hypothetical protein